MLSALVCASIGLALAGCGGAGSARTARAASAQPTRSPSRTVATITTSYIPRGQRLRGDGDTDNPNDIDGDGTADSAEDHDQDGPTSQSYRFPDGDDVAILHSGHAPAPLTARAIASVVERYYADGAGGNTVAACGLLVPSLADALAEDYGGASGPAYLRGGKSCQAILALLFHHFQAQLKEAITVVAVRAMGTTAQAIFSSKKMPASHIFVGRVDGTWRILELIGQPLP